MSSEAARVATLGRAPEWKVTPVASDVETPDTRADLEGLDDAGLVEACRGGRWAAFDILVERHRRAVYALCYRFTGNHEDAADSAQEVFLRAYRGLANFRNDASVSTWLYRIGVNYCLNRASVKRGTSVALDETAELPAPANDQAEGLIAQERADLVRAAIAKLPEKQRATVVLRVYHELTHREVAEILGTSEGAAKANLFHALANLRKLLAGRTT
jgi:RNA polymerase sigma-70 factor, ECF subfamily